MHDQLTRAQANKNRRDIYNYETEPGVNQLLERVTGLKPNKATELNQGRMSAVKQYTVTSTLQLLLTKLIQKISGVAVYVGTPRLGEEIVIKTVPNAHEGAREAMALKKLHGLLEFPQLYFAGYVKYPFSGVLKDKHASYYVIVMSFLPGASVNSVLHERHRTYGRAYLTAKEFESIERAVLTMWSRGVSHGDMHGSNVLLEPDGSAKILDFGFAAKIPPEVASAYRPGMSPEDIYALFDKHMNKVLRRRGYGHYNSDIHFLRRMYVFYKQAPKSRTSTPRSTPDSTRRPLKKRMLNMLKAVGVKF